MTDKIVLQDIRKVLKLELPSFEGSTIEIYDGLLFGQMNELSQAKDDFERGTLSLLLLIKSWNFVDEQGVSLPITRASLNQLPAKDLTFLLNKVADFFTDKEKKVKKI